MPASASIRLTTSVADIPGVGIRRAEALRRLGIRCVADLLLHLPMRYEHELEDQPIAQANTISVAPEHQAQANLAVQGEVQTTRIAGGGRRPRFEATIFDGTGTMLLTWFNAPWMRGRIHPGSHIRAWGKTKRWGDYLQMVNPKWEPITPDDPSALQKRSERFRPIYSGSEDVPSPAIEKAIDQILDPALSTLGDHLHEEFRRAKEMPTLADAYRMVHRPEHEDEVKEGRRRLAFDELLMLQLGVMLKRRHRRETLIAPALKHDARIDKRILARFPFDLTTHQGAVIDEIVRDLKRTTPMNRLVQGDVGAGKTVVALYAMLMAVASGHQAALMAPTELLAEQHFTSITQMLQGSRVRIELLTGSLKPAQKRAVHEALEVGEINLLIGTHALITKQVAFKSLAVAVIDEQHRFGVHQRALLRTKVSPRRATEGHGEKRCMEDGETPPGESEDADAGKHARSSKDSPPWPSVARGEFESPHVLVMTATPIPRTLSLTVFGDLDISTIRGLPPGRQPIATRHVPHAKAPEVYRYVAQRIEKGEQAYIVVPVIEESDSGLKDVQSHLNWLEAGPLAGRKLAAMHGRLKRDEREAIMDRFRKGEIDALVATTVIEVGVDVPNASLMVIEHADRFGLAQLHQLRGRIGRGERKSVCVLIADPRTEEGEARIQAIASTTDGFEIAEKDLAIRGPGELFGARQAGLAPFRVAQIPRDVDLLAMARRDAQKWIEENPRLEGDRDALLKKRLLKAHGKALGLGDVA